MNIIVGASLPCLPFLAIDLCTKIKDRMLADKADV